MPQLNKQEFDQPLMGRGHENDKNYASNEDDFERDQEATDQLAASMPLPIT